MHPRRRSIDTSAPYNLLILEKINRVVTTSAPMPPLNTKEPTRSVQVSRLSDLKLLRTVALPRPQRFHGVAGEYPDEARLLSDGETVLVKTSGCGLYRLDGVASAAPSAHFIYDFGYRSCPSVPIVIGNYSKLAGRLARAGRSACGAVYQ
ncbi:MAG TPA: hypothetical protein VGR69_05745 [Candidatus Rubrimentiphilum sp.]|nr:hypothetical protein [Candidatus Rubrimentiphilum sp.]